jgi:tellurite methyltransferase
VQRAIVGYHQDEHGDWVAELACGHRRHVRHDPPFQLRPWVLDEQGREGRLGTEIDCGLCDGGAQTALSMTSAPARSAGAP